MKSSHYPFLVLVGFGLLKSSGSTLQDIPYAESFYGIWFERNFEQIALECDLNGFLHPEEIDESDDLAFFVKEMEYLNDIGKKCTDEEEKTLDDGFRRFYECAEFDLKEFIGDLPSAIIGTAIECLVTLDWSWLKGSIMDSYYNYYNNDFSTMIENLDKIEPSDRCLDFEFGGSNSFGYAVRKIMEKPSKMTDCFNELTDFVPGDCTLDVHPVPIVGSFLRPVSCLLGNVGPLLKKITEYYLDFFEKCFPEDGGCTKNNETSCKYMMTPKFDMPIPDTMGNLEKEYDDKIKHYQRFMKNCTKPWEGWKTYMEYDGKYESILLSRQKETDQEPTLKQESPSATSSKTAAKTTNGVLVFFSGLFSGTVLLMLVQRLIAKRSKEQPLSTSLDTRDKDGEFL